MRYICSWSGGKDSTASIILAHLYNEPLDTIVFSEVMYDIKNNISGENPLHIDFIKNVAKPLFESWGYKVIILHSERDYLKSFHRVIKRATKHPDHIGKKYGFALSGLCSIKRDCKMKPIENFYKTLDEEYIQYVGICSDETRRLESLKKDTTKISLLDKYNYTEQMTKELCKKYNLLSPIYQFSNRGGCWFCPNAKLEEHSWLRENMPDVWKSFLALESEDNLAFSKWNAYTNETLQQREEILKLDNRQMTIFDFIQDQE